MKYFIAAASLLAISGCDFESDDKSQDKPLSSGLKIFVTHDTHVGDFENDPYLGGNNAIEKADTFCNLDPNKPNNSEYKALLVDGINRDAPSLTDWVLKANTTYYRAYGDLEIGTTTGASIFDVTYTELTNSFTGGGAPSRNVALTGISDVKTYATDGLANCENWSSTDYNSTSTWGDVYVTSYAAIAHSGKVACRDRYPLYCIEQDNPDDQ